MQLGYPHYGWYNYSNPERDNSHRVIGVSSILNDARPVVELIQEGDNVRLYAAFEDSYFGVYVGKILFEGNGYNSIEDLDQASNFSNHWWSWFPTPSLPNGGSEFPVLIDNPVVYGYDGKLFLYYVEPQKTEDSKIVQHDITYDETTPLKEYLSRPEDCYNFYSIQGVISESNGIIGLVAHTQVLGGLPRVAFYRKYPYNNVPLLNTVYVAMYSPTIMAENLYGFGSFSAKILMRSTDLEWYHSNGYNEPEFILNQASGAYTREDVSSEDRASVFTRTNASPAQLEHNEILGKFSKERLSKFDLRILIFGKDNFHTNRKIILDFTGAKVGIVDSLIKGSTIAAIKFLSSSPQGTIAFQPDSTIFPIGISLIRNGQTILIIPPNSWNVLSINNLPGIQPGDVVCFKTIKPLLAKWGYYEYFPKISGSKQAKQDLTNSDLNNNQEIFINVYPNPFNPVTTFKLTLPEPSFVNLTIFNILGQKVAELVNGSLNSGDYKLVLNGKSMSSGIYIYNPLC